MQKNILILGATGSLAKVVIEQAEQQPELNLTLFARHTECLNAKHRLIAGDALNLAQLTSAMQGQDIVYVNLAGDLATMGRSIVQAMKQAGVQRVIAISSIGIYDQPLRAVLKPYRELADIIEQSGLDYTILRPDWFTHSEEIDYQLSPKGQPEIGRTVSRHSIADFVVKLFLQPEQYNRQNLNISKP